MPLVTVDLSAKRNTARLPIIWRLGRLFNVVTNIRRARVSDDAAYVRLDIEGSTREVEQATGYLRSLGLLTTASSDALVPDNVAAPEDTVSDANTIYVRLATVNPEQDHVPVLYRVGRDFGVIVNVENAEFDEEEGGHVEIAISGPLGEVQRAIAYLHTTGLHVFPRQRSVTDYSNL
jgi:L-aspartate semialdehyde sulfurtransferase ferredoxin